MSTEKEKYVKSTDRDGKNKNTGCWEMLNKIKYIFGYKEEKHLESFADKIQNRNTLVPPSHCVILCFIHCPMKNAKLLFILVNLRKS